jgi:hypothetical protein
MKAAASKEATTPISIASKTPDRRQPATTTPKKKGKETEADKRERERRLKTQSARIVRDDGRTHRKPTKLGV